MAIPTIIEPMPPPVEPAAAAAERLAGEAQRLLKTLPIAAPFLEGWPGFDSTRRRPPHALPVTAWLHGLPHIAVPATASLVQTLVASAQDLEWGQSYTAADFGRAFLDRYGWSELIGLRGPIPGTEIACGVLLLGPDTDYPPHSHEAEELYLPLAGTALWQRGDGDFAAHAPGVPIHHPSWMPHAMRTLSEPLLALYVWRGGDLAAKSRIVAPTQNIRAGTVSRQGRQAKR